MDPAPFTFADAAVEILLEAGEPLHYKEITRLALEREWIHTEGRTPARTLNSVLCNEIQSRGEQSRFVRLGRGFFGLREATPSSPGASGAGAPPGTALPTHPGAPALAAAPGASPPAPPLAPEFLPPTHVPLQVPELPAYHEVRLLLPLWTGLSASSLRRLATERTPPAGPLAGTPSSWALEELEGEERALARLVWEGTRHQIDPRLLRGYWRLVTGHELLRTDLGGMLRLTPRGEDFLENPLGGTEQELDELEGLHRILLLLAERTPLSRRELLESWSRFARPRAHFPDWTSLAGPLLSRLANLRARGLVERTRSDVRLTAAGHDYLEVGARSQHHRCFSPEALELQALLRRHREKVRGALREALGSMAPDHLAALVQRLLEEIGYEQLRRQEPLDSREVTWTAELPLGIEPAPVVILMIRDEAPLDLDDLALLQGSVCCHGARHGCLVTTSRFSDGVREACREEDRRPVTLIDGERLEELLIQYELGVQKRSVEVWEFDAAALPTLPA